MGAGNMVTNSYNDVDEKSLQKAIDAFPKDMNGVFKGLQEAVENSGGKIMIIGGGNKVDGAYYSQIMGVDNNLTGSGEYTSDSATKLNYLEGFHLNGENIQNSYMIGSYDTIKNGKNNLVYGNYRTMEGQSGNIIIGSGDSEQATMETTVSNAVILGNNANATVEGGIALGNKSIASVDKGVAGYDPSTKAASTEKSSAWVSTDAAVSVGDGDKVTRQITGVAAGYKDTDAVNVAQLKKVKADTKDVSDEVKKNTEKINNLNQSVGNMGNRISKLDNRLDKVGAGAAALAALHPQDFDPGAKWDIAAGFGNYRDANAVAIGAFYRPNDDTMFSIGTNFGNGENMVNAGVSVRLGHASEYAGLSRAELVKKIESQDKTLEKQQAEIDELKAIVAKLASK